ncbi:YciI family protein [Bradyrhizobium sp. U87765 SZCCT0131]|uniref:YciI family protein n=1 Tax=unclassified Bradyrhizobium TaxID=2631580 RepID=UPI001BA748FF|nr:MULTISPECIES: YciI family protein [unclassified Bradyrhizobium]MBR1220888.1 YciI family protein [Bradyrhizobium sp. U87765 SZCCT0131]MBR1260292.1 YciI family protein [Bradyrhizobium sp. U87765 SZCCT0134]MBR1307459.1 YciI family protein [Bradyrhizobium sp. U87765 SZCCT0110]MBR1321413.1 YciI family protein [Bradyrhizobium sp. U87765 SZCCT0109]MBR1349726.1 YciI family protein [Bradyrhizobium sp. U87765 SZCCT0048]
MQYLLLIFHNEAESASRSPDENAALTAEYGAFTQAIVQSGNYKGGERLRPSREATTVRVRGGKSLATDGPFAETREQLGGYYLIEARDLDEANAIAARIPDARTGAIEVRPIWPVM